MRVLEVPRANTYVAIVVGVAMARLRRPADSRIGGNRRRLSAGPGHQGKSKGAPTLHTAPHLSNTHNTLKSQVKGLWKPERPRSGKM